MACYRTVLGWKELPRRSSGPCMGILYQFRIFVTIGFPRCARDFRKKPTRLRNAHFLVGSIHLAQRIANFADCGIGADAVNDERHGVGVADAAISAHHRLLRGGALQSIERAADFIVIAAGAQRVELLSLVAS